MNGEQQLDARDQVTGAAFDRTSSFQPAYAGDPLFYRMVVGFLGGVAMLAVGGAAWIALAGNTTPCGITAIGSAAVGALAGVFSATSRG